MGKSGPTPATGGGPVRFFTRLARGLVRWARRRGPSSPVAGAPRRPAPAAPVPPTAAPATAAPLPPAALPPPTAPPLTAGRPARRPPLVGEPVPCVVELPWRDWLRPAASPAPPRLVSVREPEPADLAGNRLGAAQAATEDLVRRLPPAAWTVSVVLVAAERPGGLRRPVTSVIEQSYPGWELLVVETGDGPPPALGATDPRIRVLHAPGSAVADARRRALESASGPLVAHLDEHARMAPHWLAAAVATLAQSPAADVAVGVALEAADGPPADLADLVAAGRAGRVRPATYRTTDLCAFAHRRELLATPRPELLGLTPAALLAGASVRWIDVPAVVHPVVATAERPTDGPPGLVIDLSSEPPLRLAVAGR